MKRKKEKRKRERKKEWNKTGDGWKKLNAFFSTEI